MTDIKTLNDNFRKTFTGGQVLLTAGIDSLPTSDVANIMLLVQNFTDFTPDNDPYGEHDFGSFMYNGSKIFWKIDYYDRFNTCYASENPADPIITKRVLTIMFADEW
ncbi:MAG: DUF3768 domain-containing protein [Alphaproteobacteria bacterium]|nr:DUF3768 domain-containing protein [Alphaproteobacteria bacterium]